MRSGILLVNKRSGPTSHDVVDSVRKKLGVRKVGHAGTLDPFAKGLLILGINKGTRILEYFKDMHKTYRGKMKLGLITETFDITGEVREERECNVSLEDIEEAFQSFVGEYDQVPPAYSARRYKGERLYELARKGVIIRLPPKRVKINWIRILDVNLDEKTVLFETEVSPGTYIRSLAMDVGYKLGCGAVLLELERLRIGHFSVEESIDIESMPAEQLERHIIPLNEALKDLPAIVVTKSCGDKVLNGSQVYVDDVVEVSDDFEKGALVRIIDEKGRFLAVATAERKSEFIRTLKRLGRHDRIAKLRKVFGEERG